MAGVRTIGQLLLWSLLAALAGIVFSLSPLGQGLEESWGLALLFALRGSRPPPAKVVIANIDPHSADELGLPAKLSSWPRSAHARLVDVLHEQGAGVVAFDVYFAEARDPAADQRFAGSLRRAGNTVLFTKLDHAAATTYSPFGTGPAMDILLPPRRIFSEAAAMLAPFPLPKRPNRVNQTWLFKNSAGGWPTLPAAALLVHAEGELDDLLTLIARDGAQGFVPARTTSSEGQWRYQWLRQMLLQSRGLTSRLLAHLAPGGCDLGYEQCGRLHALVKLLSGPDSMYINFYGPPATIPTWSYADFLSGRVPAHVIRDAAIFVGTARQNWVDQKDGFYTVFSRSDGLDLSGVEIAATVFANLLEENALRPLPLRAILILFLLTASLYVWICRYNTPGPAAWWLMLCIGALFGAVYVAFSQDSIWCPLVGPLAVQPLVVFLAALYWQYRQAGRERENIRQAMRYYLPDRAVRALSKDLSFIREGDRMVYSICLMTDAQHYTTLSEQMDPRQLSILMKEYYRYIFEPVREQGGVISDVVGDSMLALWPTTSPDPEQRLRACLAGLAIIRAVERFNTEHRHHQLPTRIGLHFGSLLMGNMGAANHFEYAPIGDTVNTTSRIESLNKHLQTRLLATEPVVAGLGAIQTRKLGCFLLPGKSNPVTVHEIAGCDIYPAPSFFPVLQDLFSSAHTRFVARDWRESLLYLQRCLELAPTDGPSRFYRNLCLRYMQEPPTTPWQGIIRIDLK